jgi:hypothetical protein
MLSRVNIFYTLEELIESALAFNPQGGQDSGVEEVFTPINLPQILPQNLPHGLLQETPQGVLQGLGGIHLPSIAPSTLAPNTLAAHSVQLVTQAGMKLFILLALQVRIGFSIASRKHSIICYPTLLLPYL